MDMETKTTPVPETAQEPKKIRRVGTVAFSLLLIAGGVLLIAYQIVPGFELMKILRFSPVILIALGVELLLYSAKPDVQVKFDWLAMLGSAFILCVVGVAAILPTFWNQYGPNRELAAGRLETEKIAAFYTAMTANPEVKARIDNAYAYVHFNHASNDGTYTLESGDDCQLNLTFAGAYADANAFAADCQAVMRAAEQAGVGFTKYNFDTDSEDETENSYGLSCDAAFPAGLTTDQIAQRVWTSYHYDGSSFGSQADLDEYIREQQRWEIIDEYQNDHDGTGPTEEYVEEELNRRTAEQPATAETAQA